MSDNSLWVIFNVCVTAIIITISSLLYAHYTDQNRLIVDAIKSGADPIATMCAIEDSLGDNPACIISALKDKSSNGE